MKKRWIKVLSICMALAMILVLGSCSNTNNKKAAASKESTNGEQVEITFWHAMRGGNNEEAIQALTEKFEKENPNIKVTLVSQGDYLSLFDKLMAAAKGGQLPTITQIYSNRLSWYVNKGLVKELNGFMDDKDLGYKEDELSDFPEMFLDDGKWDDKYYAMPFNKSQMVLYYNEEMLKEKGIEVPKTWEEWRDACEKLTVDEDKDGNPEVYGCVFANNISTDIAPWVKQAGGVVINPETSELYFDSPEMKEAVTFLSGLITDGYARTADDDKNSNIPLQDGRAAMCVASTSAIPYIEEGTQKGITISAAPLPAHKTNDQLFYGTNIAMFNTASEEQQIAAWRYMKFMTEPENTSYFASHTGYTPVRKSAAETDEYKKVLEEQPMKKVPFDCMDIGFQGERNIGSINALDELGKELDLVFHGGKDIDQALKDAQKKGTEAIKQAQSS